MKIIFLDIDGVVSTHRCQWKLDPEKMELIKRICDATNAKIVVTSSWRGYNLKQTIENLVDLEREAGHQPFLYPELIVGCTDRMYSFKHGNRDTHFSLPRGCEIERYCFEHQEIESYVILDDGSDMLLEHKDKFIQTHALLGISEEDAKKAIAILKGKKRVSTTSKTFDVRADLSYVSEELKDSWSIWLDYKDEIKKQYKTERGAKMMYSKLEKYSDGNPILANAIVNEAICHSWDGFYSLSDKQKDFFLSDKSPYRSENSNSSYLDGRLQELNEKIEKYK
jgi:hypothetical protein|nr:MAG: HAD domain protein [Bacteriophage sp.]